MHAFRFVLVNLGVGNIWQDLVQMKVSFVCVLTVLPHVPWEGREGDIRSGIDACT